MAHWHIWAHPRAHVVPNVLCGIVFHDSVNLSMYSFWEPTIKCHLGIEKRMSFEDRDKECSGDHPEEIDRQR
jgi:hypothetical protein